LNALFSFFFLQFFFSIPLYIQNLYKNSGSPTADNYAGRARAGTWGLSPDELAQQVKNKKIKKKQNTLVES
jgi:hypothetical protein